MRYVLAMALGLLIIANAVAAGESATSPILSAGLFKNGLVVIKRAYPVPGPGVHEFTSVPVPIHGTYFVDSTPGVLVRTGMREITVPAAAGEVSPPGAAVGHAVTLGFRDGRPEVSGILRVVPQQFGGAPFHGGNDGYRRDGAVAEFYVLDGSTGRIFFDPSIVVSIRAEEGVPQEDNRELRPVLTIEVPDEHQGPATVTATYLTRGLSWAPSYRIDLRDDGKLEIQQSAIIRNELADLEGVAMELISGFPNVEYAHVTSPLATGTSLAGFFQQLTQSPGGFAPAMSQQMLLTNNAFVMNDVAPSANVPNVGEGADLHYQSIGKRSLRQGEAMNLTIATAEAPYEAVVEWNVPADRARGHNDAPISEDLWDAVRFRNPFDFPMTTAPAMVTADGRFLGSRTVNYTNPGDEVLAYVGKALSVRVQTEEREGDAREPYEIARRRYTRSTVDGELTVRNLRQEPVSMIIRKELTGTLISADGEPAKVVGKEGPGHLNPSTKLTWNVDVPAGEKLALAYRYYFLAD